MSDAVDPAPEPDDPDAILEDLKQRSEDPEPRRLDRIAEMRDRAVTLRELLDWALATTALAAADAYHVIVIPDNSDQAPYTESFPTAVAAAEFLRGLPQPFGCAVVRGRLCGVTKGANPYLITPDEGKFPLFDAAGDDGWSAIGHLGGPPPIAPATPGGVPDDDEDLDEEDDDGGEDDLDDEDGDDE